MNMRKYGVGILFLVGATKLFPQKLIHTELLGRPTDKSITIQLIFQDASEVAIQYGTTTGNYTNQTNWFSFAAGVPAEITIASLTANTKYFYRTLHRLPGSGTYTTRPEYTFQTQRTAGESFSFIVQADPHLDEQSDSALYRRCLRNQLEDKPDFMVDLGDILMSDKLRNNIKQVTHDTVIYRAKMMRNYYETSCHSVPLFITLGNHEGEAGWYQNGTAENVAIWGSNERKKYYVNPYPDNFYTGDTTNNKFIGLRENYYSWIWGDALFIVIDPYWYTKVKPDSLNGWRWTLGKSQYDWLKKTLENSNAKFKFVFSHQIVGGDADGRGGVEFANKYEWGGNNLDGTYGFASNRPGWYKPIKDLLAEHRVTIFFHGHDHFFGKQEKSCLIYQETPQPSHPNYTSATYAKTYGYLEGQILPNSGHLRVTVNSLGVKVEYVRAYMPASESGSRHNKDVSATYFIGAKNCYDSTTASLPIIWNQNYSDELVYPNPFSEKTNIVFNLNSRQNITLSIFNVSGQLVRSLIENNELDAGKYQIIWDGNNNKRTKLPKGIYTYELSGYSGLLHSGKIIIE